jgi:hypothetical protein
MHIDAVYVTQSAVLIVAFPFLVVRNLGLAGPLQPAL